MNALELSARADDTGGPVAEAVKPAPDHLPLLTSRILILVHGFNNSRSQASASYQKFFDNSGLGGVSAAGQACAFYWPGDKDWSWFSFVSYPSEITPAKDSAALLHRFLKGLRPPGGWPLEIALVCHSLGNLLSDPEAPRLNYRAACFMAAAVPVTLVEDPTQLRPAALAPQRTLVLHSASDAVLHWAFPPGETSAGDGFFPQAVGRFGEPSGGLWSSRSDMGLHSYGHSDYWDHAESAAAVASFLAIAVDRPTPESATPTRSMPPPRTLPTRSLAPRGLPDR